MDYFLSAQNSTFNFWQIDLMIESFNQLNKESSLAVCTYSDSEANAQSFDKRFFANLSSHQRKVFINNTGLARGCTDLNKLYNILGSLTTGFIKQPFTALEPYIVFRKDYFMPEPEVPSFVFYMDPLFTLEEVEKNVGPFYDWLKIERESFESGWIPIGEIYSFNKLPLTFFSSAVVIAEKLALHQMLEKNKVWHRTVDLAIAINALVTSSGIQFRGDCAMVSPINTDFDSPLISYKDGFPPQFFRSMYSFIPPTEISFGDPIEELSKIDYTMNSRYTSNLARSILERRT